MEGTSIKLVHLINPGYLFTCTKLASVDKLLLLFFFPYPTGILFQLALSHGGLKCVLKIIVLFKVLTCLGIHLWDRLHRLWQKLRAEEQTWQMLFYLGVEALRKSFEVHDLMCGIFPSDTVTGLQNRFI